jgi:ATP-dependent helicase HrpB
VARKRPGSAGTYLLASGRAATLPESDALAKSDWLVVADLGGASKEARISLAVPISESDALASGNVISEDRAGI